MMSHWHSSSLSPGLDTVHTARILCFPLYHCGQSRGQQAIGRGDRSLSPPRDRQRSVAVIHSDRLSYGCIYKTHFFPIMLVSISMCDFSMLLKYRTLYSKSKMSLNQEKLLTNDVNMSTIVSLNFLHLRTMTLSSLSNFITTSLGRMKAWAACNSLDWVTCFPFHFKLARITDPSSCLHTCTLWRPQ